VNPYSGYWDAGLGRYVAIIISYTLQYYDNGNWVNINPMKTISMVFQERVHSFPQETSSKVSMLIKDASAEDGIARLFEIQVFGREYSYVYNWEIY